VREVAAEVTRDRDEEQQQRRRREEQRLVARRDAARAQERDCGRDQGDGRAEVAVLDTRRAEVAFLEVQIA
jgi:hypothetical protein